MTLVNPPVDGRLSELRLGTGAHVRSRVAKPSERACGTGPSVYFLGLSAAAASLAVGTVPPAAWVMLISDSVEPTKTSSIRP
jgi:hypothetical protein